MRTIHKIPVASGLFHIQLPKGAKILTVQTQRGQPQMWALLDTLNDPERRSFIAFPTGVEIAPDVHLDYIGTFQLADGARVFHLFEVLN